MVIIPGILLAVISIGIVYYYCTKKNTVSDLEKDLLYC